jgi:hypothetical protein
MSKSHQCWESCCGHTLRLKIWTLAVSTRTQPQRQRCPKIWTLAVSTRTQPQTLLCPQNSSYYFVTSPYLSVLGTVLLQKLTLTQLQLFPSTHSYRTVHISRVCYTFGLITSHHKACSFKNKWWFVMPKRVAKPLTHVVLLYAGKCTFLISKRMIFNQPVTKILFC